VQRDARNGRISGQSADEAVTAVPDPQYLAATVAAILLDRDHGRNQQEIK